MGAQPAAGMYCSPWQLDTSGVLAGVFAAGETETWAVVNEWCK